VSLSNVARQVLASAHTYHMHRVKTNGSVFRRIVLWAHFRSWWGIYLIETSPMCRLFTNWR
jgi:hypothetical protein